MKSFLLMITFFINTGSFAQHSARTKTAGVSVEGYVKHPFVFRLSDVSGYPIVAADSFVIYNHLMERKKMVGNIQGVLLKDVIEKAGINVDKPKLLNEIYFTCIATDNYKVTFSWNELYNNALGKKVILITSINGKDASTLNDSIILASATDEATGRRFVSNLAKVIVSRVD